MAAYVENMPRHRPLPTRDSIGHGVHPIPHSTKCQEPGEKLRYFLYSGGARVQLINERFANETGHLLGSINRNRNRKVDNSAVPTKAKSREPAYSQALKFHTQAWIKEEGSANHLF